MTAFFAGALIFGVFAASKGMPEVFVVFLIAAVWLILAPQRR